MEGWGILLRQHDAGLYPSSPHTHTNTPRHAPLKQALSKSYAGFASLRFVVLLLAAAASMAASAARWTKAGCVGGNVLCGDAGTGWVGVGGNGGLGCVARSIESRPQHPTPPLFNVQ